MASTEVTGVVASPQRGGAKAARIPIKVVAGPVLSKPGWIRVRVSSSERFGVVERALREAGVHTVCEEAACQNITECLSVTWTRRGSRRSPCTRERSGIPMPPADPWFDRATTPTNRLMPPASER